MESGISEKEKTEVDDIMSEFPLPHDHGDSKNLTEIRHELTDAERFDSAAEVFSRLSDPMRVRLFWLLCHSEQCVINIAALLDMSSPAVSHHLRVLSDSRLIVSRRVGKEVYYRVADSELTDLLHKVVERVMEVACPETIPTHETTPEEIARAVHSYLTEHLSERITIEELSREFLMNTTTLKRAFKNVYGTSIALHMKQHRIEAAQAMLTGTRKDISEIAREVGYTSQSRFSEAFREICGVLPTEYRKMNSGKDISKDL